MFARVLLMVGEPGGVDKTMPNGEDGAPGPAAELRFYEELNDRLPAHLRKRAVPFPVGGSPTVGQALAAWGVPLDEVDLVVVNGEPVGPGHRLGPGDRVAVYPVFESLDISPVTRLRPRPLRRTALLLGPELGGLARLLRALGLDAALHPGPAGPGIVRRAREEGRVILTRDPGLLRDPGVTHGCRVRSRRVPDQAAEVLRRLDLHGSLRPFTRCVACNTPLDDAGDPPGPRGRVRRCPGCGRAFAEAPFLRLASRLAGARGSGRGPAATRNP